MKYKGQFNTERLELKEKRFGECIVRTWKRSDDNWSIAPWLFSVQKDGEDEREFSGVPNYCETRHKALMRGWYRAKWLNEGTYEDRYIKINHFILPGVYTKE